MDVDFGEKIVASIAVEEVQKTAEAIKTEKAPDFGGDGVEGYWKGGGTVNEWLFG